MVDVEMMVEVVVMVEMVEVVAATIVVGQQGGGCGGGVDGGAGQLGQSHVTGSLLSSIWSLNPTIPRGIDPKPK